MHDAVLAACRWLESMPWAVTIRLSSWQYPVVLWAHFIGLSMFLATTVAVDLRLMGVGARRFSAAQLSRDLFAWNWIGFAVAFFGGFLLLSAEATTYAANLGFWLKLGVAFPLATIWHVVVQRKVSGLGAWAGLIEVVFWILVVTASVWFLLTNAVTHPPG